MITLHEVLTIENPANEAISRYILQQGIPCQQGKVWLKMDFVLVDQLGCRYPVATKSLALWPDNSVKWLQLNAVIAIPAMTSLCLSVQQEPAKSIKHAEFCRFTSQQLLQIQCQDVQYMIDHKGVHQSAWSIGFGVHTGSLHLNQLRILSLQEYVATSPLYCDIQCAVVADDNATSLHTHLNLRIVYASGDCYIESVLHNAQCANHPNGTWDLGDPNSMMIDDWFCRLTLCQTEAAVASPSVFAQLTTDSDFDAISPPLLIQQLSSGGHNWHSDAHVNAQLFQPLEHQSTLMNHQTTHHMRVNPVIKINSHKQEWYTHLRYFWEKFPSALDVQSDSITWHMHDSQVTSLSELQPGERWQREISITRDHCQHQQQITVILDPIYVNQTSAVEMHHTQLLDSPLQGLLDEGIVGHAHFFTKRETADMFGFRHFGELYADHEAAQQTHQPNDKAFISFYNNQYDPLLGFIRQWLLTGNADYFTLAQQLAQHICHIDIYHTQADKPEYNGGLFWHTDHYLPALSCTHRTYSHHHQANAYEDHAGGGGPGGQHCYTTGLLYHYYLTGDRYSKEAVMSLYRWIEQVYDGDNSLVGLLLALKNRHRVDLKNITTNTYPLDRGTANYIHATLDMFMLQNDQYYLHKAFAIIVHTVNAQENLTDRQLDDVEHTWFYTVFLQAVMRFMRICQHYPKASAEHSLWQHCADIIVLFANWMLTNEQPYLHNPDKLEYPNQTWSGQDLRKVDVLSYAAFIHPDQATAYQTCADSIQTFVVQQLQRSDERSYTRIQALIMQNYGGREFYDGLNQIAPLALASPPRAASLAKAKLKFHQIAVNNLANWSIKHELSQLKKRSKRLQKWIN